MDVICPYMQDGGMRRSIFIGVDKSRFIPIFYSWEAAREWAGLLEQRLGWKLGFAFLKGVSRGSLEKEYLKLLPLESDYTFVYEGTPEFEKLRQVLVE